MADIDFDRYRNLTFESFKRLAKDDSLSPQERVGFPDAYRAGKEDAILQDIAGKLSNLRSCGQLVLDIGPGCSGLAFMIIDLCRQQGHTLLLIDSQEMLDRLPDEPFITKIPGYFPDGCLEVFERYFGKINVILTYSVLHYVFGEGNVFDFLDRSLSLLADGGEMLIGDIPNVSKRKRFLSSPNGIRFHQEFMATDGVPAVSFNTLEWGKIDDAVILGLILRARQAGFDAYWLPQGDNLPMANRREDVLIRKP